MDEPLPFASNTDGSCSANVISSNPNPTPAAPPGGQQEVLEDASELIFPDEFKDAQTLLIAEVHSLLQYAKDQNNQHEDEFHMPNEVFEKTMKYTEKFARFKKNETITAVRNHLMTKKLHQYEIAALANLCPDSAEEACALIPSLETRFEERELEAILTHIQSLISYDK